MVITQHEDIKVADEVWVAVALLHKEQPQRAAFTPAEIRQRVEQEAVYGTLRPGVYTHVVQHCVANLPPNPGRYRMLFAEGRTRRLFRAGDAYHPDREGGKVTPDAGDLPPRYRYLLDWYASEYAGSQEIKPTVDMVLQLRGSGRDLWADEEPDAYVQRLREGWA